MVAACPAASFRFTTFGLTSPIWRLLCGRARAGSERVLACTRRRDYRRARVGGSIGRPNWPDSRSSTAHGGHRSSSAIMRTMCNWAQSTVPRFGQGLIAFQCPESDVSAMKHHELYEHPTLLMLAGMTMLLIGCGLSGGEEEAFKRERRRLQCWGAPIDISEGRRW